MQLGNHSSNLTQEQLETHTIAAWKEGKFQQFRTLDSNGGSYPWRFVHVSAHELLWSFFFCFLHYSFILCKIVNFLYVQGCKLTYSGMHLQHNWWVLSPRQYEYLVRHLDIGIYHWFNFHFLMYEFHLVCFWEKLYNLVLVVGFWAKQCLLNLKYRVYKCIHDMWTKSSETLSYFRNHTRVWFWKFVLVVHLNCM